MGRPRGTERPAGPRVAAVPAVRARAGSAHCGQARAPCWWVRSARLPAVFPLLISPGLHTGVHSGGGTLGIHPPGWSLSPWTRRERQGRRSSSSLPAPPPPGGAQPPRAA
eukprot:13970889-Alexandrium_andersonii.AAC.1